MRKYKIKRLALLPLFTCFGVARRLWSWNKRCIRWGWQYHFYRKNLKGVRDYGTSLFSWRVQESLSNDERAVHSSGYAHISRSSVFSHYSLKLMRLIIHCNNVAVRYFNRLSDTGLVLCLEAWGQPCWFPGSKELGTSRNGRMERNFPVSQWRHLTRYHLLLPPKEEFRFRIICTWFLRASWRHLNGFKGICIWQKCT